MIGDNGYHPLAQYTIDKIHGLVLSLESFIRKKGPSSSKINERLAIGALKDIYKLTEKLFEHGGSNAVDIIEQLGEIDDLLAKLNDKRKGLGLDNDELNRLKQDETHLHSDIINCPITFKSLQDIILNVKQSEKTFSFQHSLWLEKKATAKVLDCSIEQLTYGSSSIDLWMKLVDNNLWKDAIDSNVPIDDGDDDKPKVVIFGSSQGLLSFYSSALNYIFHKNNISVIGYEILPYLNNKAQQLLSDHWQFHCHIGNDVTFVNEDMMNANVKDANIVILTSLCWDIKTRQKVAKKLSNEMKKPNSIVIDYRDDTFKISGLDYNYYKQELGRIEIIDAKQSSIDIIRKMSIENMKKALFNAVNHIDRNYYSNEVTLPKKTKQLRRFNLKDIVSGPASWNSNQNLYIYC